MMPVIRVPDDVFQRLQKLAEPLVDTPASVIERLLDLQERIPATQVVVDRREEPEADSSPTAKFETYENRSNPHVTVHRVGCSQLRKRGGVHRHGQGSYKAHATFAKAEHYAKQTGLPIRMCGYCRPEEHSVKNS